MITQSFVNMPYADKLPKKRPVECLLDGARPPGKKSKTASSLNVVALNRTSNTANASSIASVKRAKAHHTFLSLRRELRQAIFYMTYIDGIPQFTSFHDFICRHWGWHWTYFKGCHLPRTVERWGRHIKTIHADVTDDIEYVETAWKRRFEALNEKHVKQYTSWAEFAGVPLKCANVQK
jgi:hypothetical protein